MFLTLPTTPTLFLKRFKKKNYTNIKDKKTKQNMKECVSRFSRNVIKVVRRSLIDKSIFIVEH